MHNPMLYPSTCLVFMLTLLASATACATSAGHELLFMNAQNAAALSTKDRQEIYAQYNFNVGADGKSLVFADAQQCPPLLVESGDIQVTTEDLNGDQHPEVFVSLGSSCMFGGAGIGVSLFIKDGSGRWQSHDIGAGMYSVEKTQHQGYADLMIGGPGFCQPVLRWDGSTYVLDRMVAEQPGGCDGQ